MTESEMSNASLFLRFNLRWQLAILVLVSIAPIFVGSPADAALPLCPQTQIPVQTSKSNAAVEKIATSASNAQNNNDFKFAQKQWEKLVDQHPSWSKIATAKLNLGICLFQQKKYAEAIAPIRSAVEAGDQSLNIPKSLLFLGFSQMKYGDQLALSQAVKEQTQGGMFLTTATQTLGKIVKEYPDYPDADQALYFQGQAFYKLGRYEEAIAAFEGLGAFEDAKFKEAAQYDLASAYQQSGKFDRALSTFEKYLNSVPTEDVEAVDDINLQIAKLNTRLATAARGRQESVEAVELLKQADERLSRISENPESAFFADACFHQAIVAGELEDFSRAAKLFEQAASDGKSPNSGQAMVMAGREWIRAEQYPIAIKTLEPLATADSRFGLEAVILLSNAYRNSGAPEKATALTESWIERSANAPLYVALLMENAEAAYATPKMKRKAAQRFLEIADKFPEDRAAPEALFNATAAWWESYETDKAIETAERFLKYHSNHRLALDVQEMLGDAQLVKENYAAGEQAFRAVAKQFPNSKQQSHWALRTGWALYLQKKYPETEAWLTERIDSFKLPKLASEARHWIGASQYQQKDYANALVSLQESIDSVQQWERADETLLALFRCHLATDNVDEARLTAAKIKSQFPQSPAIAESVFRIGETLYDNNKLDDAAIQYQTLLAQFPDSEFVPASLLGQGWALLRTDKAEEAEKLFDELIERFPENQITAQARMARSVAHRKLGKSGEAIEALKQFIATAPEGDAKSSSRFELGLAYVENENWEQAEKVFRDLLALPDENRLADRTRYELAWTLESLNRLDDATDQFQDLAEKFPQSPLAAEANFKVATALYDQEKYDDASTFYNRVINGNGLKVSDELMEKALYKLAWSSYKQNRFEQAADRFGEQTSRFSEGKLAADGQFMLAQSWFENEDYAKALEAYVVAKPVVLNSKSAPERLKWLTMINGAKSANQQKSWQQAIDFAMPLTTSGAGQETQNEAWFEIGQARMGLKQEDGAIDAWQRASTSTGKIGAHARVMKGDMLFKQKRFDEAIDEFKLVFYGYGGTESAPEIRSLQAYAVYESARCSYVRISEASDRMKPKLVKDSIERFTYLVENYPDQTLAKDALKQLETLKSIKNNPKNALR